MLEAYFTLIFIKSANNLLLGFKKRGLGKGTWNGYGGKLEGNETAFEAAIRELHEESNLEVSHEDLNYLGLVSYTDASVSFKRIVYIFTASQISGDLRETEEMKPEWFGFDDLPYDNMWPDSRFWLPLVLKDCWLQARFSYTRGYDIAEYEVQELQTAPTVPSRSHSCTYAKCGHGKSCEYKGRAMCVENNV